MEDYSFTKVCELMNLPDEICQSYQNKGLKTLHQWQMECLFQTNVLDGNNLIYCAPTGGGKTLVAELIILKTVITLKKRAILILPYVSLVTEKEKEFRRVVLIYNRSRPISERIRIRGYHGEAKALGKLKEHIIICTIEKANSIANTLISRGLLNQLGCIVVDEMHVLGDFHRGYHLEILISKMKFIVDHFPRTSAGAVQLIALSATIQNIEDLASWFGASLYVTNYRPVPLREMICAGVDIYDIKGDHLRKLELPKFNLDTESIAMLLLAAEAIQSGQQVIIFCSSRNKCESTVRLFCNHSQMFMSSFLDENVVELRKKSLEKYKETYLTGCRPTSSQELIERGIENGIAYHHAGGNRELFDLFFLGLSAEERSVIENLFREGILRFLAATTTLAAGVNLPAGRVLIRSMRVGHNQNLEPIQYRQMCGRAGRPGLTDYGESILIVKPSDRQEAVSLCNRPIPKITSQIHPAIDGGKAFLRVLLELFLLHLCETLELVEKYVTHTMVFLECRDLIPSSGATLLCSVRSLLQFLVSANAIELFPLQNPHQLLTDQAIYSPEKSSVGIRVTRFGRSIAESNLNPDEAISIYEDLIRAREQGINLESNLHLLYLITPQNHCLTPDFRKLLTIYEQSKIRADPVHNIFDAVGIDPTLLLKWTHISPTFEQLSSCVDRLKLFKIKCNQNSLQQCEERDCVMLYRCLRIWAASALNMLVETQSLAKVAVSYNITVNDVISLQKSACYLGSRLARFCQEIGWTSLEKLISFISASVNFEPDKDIRELMMLEGMTSKLAKTLFQNGFETITQLASGNEDDVVHRLLLSRQFEATEEGTPNFVATSPESMYLFATSLINKARTYLQEKAETKESGDSASETREYSEEQDFSSDESESSDDEVSMGYMHEAKVTVETTESELIKISSQMNPDLYAVQLPADDADLHHEDEISDEALIRLIENFDSKRVNCGRTPWKKPEATSPTPYPSPYLQPFTPSKCSTPGRYLYLPSLDNSTHNPKAAEVPNFNKAHERTLCWRHLSEPQYCLDFLHTLGDCTSLSFELVFDTIPLSPVGLSQSIVSKAWAPMITKCYSGDSKKDHNNPALNEILVGISMSFGNDIGYYLPLPTIPPLLCIVENKIPAARKVSSLESLPDRAMILICRYVGFGRILHKCPGLYPMDIGSNFFSTNSNPLFVVSKRWAECFRRSLRYEWMRGQCLEWRLLGKVMNSTTITKVGFEMKEKLICLRERDVMIRGLIKDPKIAEILLELETSVPLRSIKSYRSPTAIKESCFTAINVFHHMTAIEFTLHLRQLWSTFISIEMPLCYTVADAELNGIPIDTTFFTDLRQDLTDRVKLIEHYFRETQGFQFSLSNPKDVSKLKSELSGQEDHPALQLVQEWRSHTRILPLCNMIFSHRCRPYGHSTDRTRGKYHSIGTETGRLIIASPPLQQVPHSCSYPPPRRVSLHIELQRAKLNSDIRSFIQNINRRASSGEMEWVRVTKMRKNPPLACDELYTDNNMKPLDSGSASTGRLIAVTSIPIAKTLIPDQTSGVSLLDIWREAGYNYTEEDGASIVGILINIQSKIYNYPADQVFRLQASIIPDPDETSSLRSSLNSSSSNQSSFEIPKITLNPRDGFRATPGHLFIASDYSQIELRIFAHFAMDKKLYDAFIRDEDVFRSIAAQWKSKAVQSVSDDERNSVKQLCYALLYGAGPNKVALDAGCSVQEAEQMIQNFLQSFSGIQKFINEVKRRCRVNGFVETMLGRKRHLPNIRSSDKKDRARAERQAVNTVCQGSAADLVKLAMINIHHCLEKRYEAHNFHSRRSYPGGGLYSILDSIRLVLQVHDELIYEVPENLVHEVGYIVKSCMENAVELNVPLKVKLFSGQTWGSMTPLEIDPTKNYSSLQHELFPENEMEISDSTSKISSLKPVARCIFQDGED